MAPTKWSNWVLAVVRQNGTGKIDMDCEFTPSKSLSQSSWGSMNARIGWSENLEYEKQKQ